MKLTIKNLQYMDGQDGLVINCDFAYKGKIFLHAHDSGNGGSLGYYIQPNTPENQLAFNKFKTYVHGLPEYDWNEYMRSHGYKAPDEPRMEKKTIEDVLNDLIDEAINKKEMGQFNRDIKKGIVFGKDTYRYKKAWWKNTNLEKMCAHPKGKQIVQAKVDEIKSQLEEKESILNAVYLKTLGIKI